MISLNSRNQERVGPRYKHRQSGSKFYTLKSTKGRKVYSLQSHNIYSLQCHRVGKILWDHKRPSFFLFYLFLTEGQLLYNIMLVSAIYQHESAIGIHNSEKEACQMSHSEQVRV